MTPKEKAKELVDKFSLQMPVQIIPIASTRSNQLSCDMDLKAHLKNAKQCALIAVQELIDQCHSYREIDLGMSLEYLEEFKQEIEKL